MAEAVRIGPWLIARDATGTTTGRPTGPAGTGRPVPGTTVVRAVVRPAIRNALARTMVRAVTPLAGAAGRCPRWLRLAIRRPAGPTAPRLRRPPRPGAIEPAARATTTASAAGAGSSASRAGSAGWTGPPPGPGRRRDYRGPRDPAFRPALGVRGSIAVQRNAGARIRRARPGRATNRPAIEPLAEDEELVAGRRPVEEAFVAGRGAHRLLVTPQRRHALEQLVLHATRLRIPIVEVEGGSLTALAGFDGHQGVALVVGPRRFASLDDILARAIERDEPPFVLVLDSLEDPQNLGTLLRSAEAAGVHGVVFPTRRQAPLTPSAIKASAGAVEHLLLCPVDDLPGAWRTSTPVACASVGPRRTRR